MCLYISRYIVWCICLMCLSCSMLDMLNTSVEHFWLFDSQCLTCLTCHVICLDSINLITFQYYLDCDCMFNLFNCIEIYSCKASLLLSQLISEFCLWLIELYSSCHEVKNSLINLLCSVFKDSLQSLKFSFNMIIFAHQHDDYSWKQQQQCHRQCRQQQQHVYC